MTQTFKILLGFFLFNVILSFSSPIFAQTNKGGIVRDGDTIYLSTDVDNDTTLATATISSNVATSDGRIQIPTGFATTITNLLNGLLSFVMLIAALLVFFYLIWGAISWITSGGDKAKTDSARQKIISAVVGLLIIAASFAVATVVLNFLGFSSFNDVFTNVRTIDGGTTNIE